MFLNIIESIMHVLAAWFVPKCRKPVSDESGRRKVIEDD